MKLRALFLSLAAPVAIVSSGLLGCSSSGDGGTEANSALSTDGGSANNGASACANLASGPFTPTQVFQGLTGSEDFAFDGKGNIAARSNNKFVIVNAQGQATPIAGFNGQIYGLRYHPNGNLIAAIPGSGALAQITPSGQGSILVNGLGGPNGVYPDFDGNIWVTEFNGSQVTRIAPDLTKEVVVSGADLAQAANGIAINAASKILFYTEYSKAKIHRIDLKQQTHTSVEVATIPGAALDGIVLDACGNVYAVDQRGSKVYRVKLDAETGAAVAAPELLASLPANVANAQFGSGPGFDSKALYLTGNPGVIFSIPVGVGGSPVPVPADPPAAPADAGTTPAPAGDAG
jgi:hypothetical protein